MTSKAEETDKEKISIAGKIKVWQIRLAGYISLVNFIMIFYLYIVESPLGLEWYHWASIIILGCTIIIFIDIRYIFPASQEYIFNKNPSFKKLKKTVEDNQKMLKNIITLLEEDKNE